LPRSITPPHLTPKLPRRSARKLKRDPKPPSPPSLPPCQSPKLNPPLIENGDHAIVESKPIPIAKVKVHSYVKNGTTFFRTTPQPENDPVSPQLTPSSPMLAQPMLMSTTPLPVVAVAPNQTMAVSPVIPNGIGPHLSIQADNWSTTPTSTSTSITNHTKTSVKKFKCHSVPNFRFVRKACSKIHIIISEILAHEKHQKSL
jgi:hypothetical protein